MRRSRWVRKTLLLLFGGAGTPPAPPPVLDQGGGMPYDPATLRPLSLEGLPLADWRQPLFGHWLSCGRLRLAGRSVARRHMVRARRSAASLSAVVRAGRSRAWPQPMLLTRMTVCRGFAGVTAGASRAAGRCVVCASAVASRGAVRLEARSAASGCWPLDESDVLALLWS